MDDKELESRLDKMREGLKLFDRIVFTDFKTGEGRLNERQVELVQSILDLFDELNWQIKFNNYKEITCADDKPIDLNQCGTPVKVRSCKKEHGDKTYFGILIGDVPLSISHSIEDEVVTARRSFYNPAIFVPELKTIVYGCESWWGEIESEEDLKDLITEETVKNVWYMKALTRFTEDKQNG